MQTRYDQERPTLSLFEVYESADNGEAVTHYVAASDPEEAFQCVREAVDPDGSLFDATRVPADEAWPCAYPDGEPEDAGPEGAVITRDPEHGCAVVSATAGAWAAYYGRAVYLGSSEDR